MNNDELLIVLKDIFEKKVEEVKQYTGMLVEKLEGDIKIVAEGHSILNSKLDNLDKKVDNLDKKVDYLDKKVDNLDKRVEFLEKDIKCIKSYMIVVKDYIIGVDAKLNEHEVILKRVK